MCECVCVREREGNEKGGERARGRRKCVSKRGETRGEDACVCVYMCVCV